MGKISKGILGPVSGTVGTVVGSSWRGINYLRSKSNRGKRAASVKQAQQQKKFALTMQFVRPLNALLSETFGKSATNMTGANSAMSYIIKNAVKGDFPDYTIDYSLVQLSRGNLPGASKATAVVAANAVRFTWDNNSGTGSALPADNAILIVYSPNKKQAVYTTKGAARSAATQDLDVTQFKGDEVHAYIAFTSADGREVSDSLYLGKLAIAA